MDIPTIPGAWYTVATATTCEITDTATGTPLGTANAGSYTFQAQGNLTTLSDDSALYSKSNFKSAPAALMALGLLGGGSSTPSLPSGYLAAAFLESTGAQYIDSSYIPNNETGVRLDIECTIQGDYVPMGCRNSATTETRYYALRPTPGSTHGFGWGAWFFTVHEIVGEKRMVTMLNYCNSRKAESKYVSRGLVTLPFTPLYSMFIFAANVAGTPALVYGGRIWNAAISQGAEIAKDFIPAIDSQGLPCMYEKLSKTPFYNSGSVPFIVGLTLAQARKLSNLPATGGTLTVSLPTGYDSDSGVMAALETARANGWTLTIQTYTPEAAASASTFSLRRIWVRRTADENGAHVAADGTRWHVEWCIDMLTPDGSTPDAYGYELFRSQEAAVAYWELSPYVDPESENLLTE